MRMPLYSALLLSSFLLATPGLGGLRRPDSSRLISQAAQTPGGSAGATVIGQQSGKGGREPATDVRPAGLAQGEAATPTHANLPEPWRTILAAETVAVVGMDEFGKKCSAPPYPCGKRQRTQAELSLRKWGRFRVLEDPREADLVVVTMESFSSVGSQDETWVQLRVFKGPVAPAFLADVQKKLAAQLKVYTGPVAMEKGCEPLWEGWRCTARPGVPNPAASRVPSPGMILLLGVLNQADKKLREKQLEDRIQENPYDPQVIGEVVGNDVDAIKGLMDLTGTKAAKVLDRMVAEDFCRAVEETGKPSQPVSAIKLRRRGSAPPQAHLTPEHPKEGQPAPPLMWLELAVALVKGGPVQEVIPRVKERGIAFDADREALWSLQALGAPEALLQAVQAARVENYYEPDPRAWADFRAAAAPILWNLLKTQQSNPVLHFAMGRALDGEAPSDGAAAEYRAALQLNPRFETARLNLAIALGKKGNLKDAIKELRELIRLDPVNALAHDNLGVALDRKGDLDGSVAEHRVAVRLKPDSVTARVNLGLALDEKRDWDGALAEFREAVRLAPRYASAHHALGLGLARKGDLVGARPELQEAVRLSPNNPSAHNDLGKVLQYQGDLDSAAGEYREALRLQPNFPEADRNLAAVVRLKEKSGVAEK